MSMTDTKTTKPDAIFEISIQKLDEQFPLLLSEDQMKSLNKEVQEQKDLIYKKYFNKLTNNMYNELYKKVENDLLSKLKIELTEKLTKKLTVNITSELKQTFEIETELKYKNQYNNAIKLLESNMSPDTSLYYYKYKDLTARFNRLNEKCKNYHRSLKSCVLAGDTSEEDNENDSYYDSD